MAIEEFSAGVDPDAEELLAAMAEDGEAEPEEEQDKKVVELVEEDIDRARQYNDSNKATREDAYNLYRGGKIGGEREGRSQVVSSDLMDTIEWIMPGLMRIFTSSGEPVLADPVGSEDVERAELVSKYLNYQLMQQCDGFLIFYLLAKAALVYRTGCAKVTWVDKYEDQPFAYAVLDEEGMKRLMGDPNTTVEGMEEDVVMREPQNLMERMAAMMTGNMNGMVPVRVFRNVSGYRHSKVYSGPDIQVIPREDLYVDPSARSLDDAQFAAHRVFRTLDYLYKKQDEGVYKNVDKVKASAQGRKDRNSSEDGEDQSRYASADQSAPWNLAEEPRQLGRREIEVFEWYGYLDIEDTGRMEPYMVTIAEGQLLRKERRPFVHGMLPFVMLSPILDLFKLEGIGMADLVGDFQKIKTFILRQMIDNLSYQNNGLWEVDRNAGVDLNALLHPAPGRVVRTNRLNGFRDVTPKALSATAIQALDFVQTQLEQRTGVTRYNQGLDSKSLNKTATGISQIMNASQQRQELIARVMAETGFKRLGKLMLSMTQQFVDTEQVFRIFGKSYTITPGDLSGTYDVTISVGVGNGRSEVQQQQMLQLLSMAGNLVAGGIMTTQNVRYAVEKLLNAWGYKEVDRFLADPVSMEQLKQSLMILSQMNEAVQTGAIADVQLAQGLTAVIQTLSAFLGIPMPGGGVAGGDPHGGGAPGPGPSQPPNAFAGIQAESGGGTVPA